MSRMFACPNIARILTTLFILLLLALSIAIQSTINPENDDYFSLLCDTGPPLLLGEKPMHCSPYSGTGGSECPEGYWCHVGSSKTTTYCCPLSTVGEGDCYLPPAPGYGTGSMTRWWYDWAAQLCRNFTYTGYGGNQNNHLTSQECENKCFFPIAGTVGVPYEPPSPTTPILQPGQPLTHSIFNPANMGNHNQMGGPATTFVDYEYEIYPGVNPSGLPSVSGLNPPSISELNPSVPTNVRRKELNPRCLEVGGIRGDGTAFATKWYFNSNIQRCQSFWYSGVGGTSNRFDSEFECNYYCGDTGYVTEPSGGYQPVDPTVGGEDELYGQGPSSMGPSSNVNTASSVDPCSLPYDQGQQSMDGLGHMGTRYYWNLITLTCSVFNYKGAGGNSNNFLNIRQCEDTCGPSKPVTDQNKCRQTQMRGGGSYQILRWSFNFITKSCQQFYYSGCCGNDNRFVTQMQCIQSCGRQYPNVPSGGNRGPNSLPPFGERPSGSRAQPTTFPFKPFQPFGPFQPSGPRQGGPGDPCMSGGSGQFCRGNSNYRCPPGQYCHVGSSITTTICCNTRGDACSLPPQEGNGNDRMNRFFFNFRTKRCENLVYRGLKGNENNFLTFERCMKRCAGGMNNPCGVGVPLKSNGMDMKCSSRSRCPDNSFCHIGVDSSATVCCPATTRQQPGNVCELAIVSGQGTGSLQRWAFNSQSGQCELFLYQGLGGNENNFLTQADCVNQCRQTQNPCGSGRPLGGGEKRFCSTSNPNVCPSNFYCHIGSSAENTLCCPTSGSSPCRLPLMTGQGNALMSRWYFDPTVSICKAFTYTGMGGNENNFLSLADCRRVCPEYDNPCPAGNPPISPATGQVNFCSAVNPSCPTGYWCHIGNSRQTSVCCPFPANPCAMPRADGTGTGQLPRYYYNPLSRICETFSYTGKGGNQNNFMGKAECEAACPVLDNPCSAGMPAITAEGNPLLCSTANPSVCPSSFWCHIGSNAATTLCCPGAGDPCRMPKSRGNSNSVLNRWYYNTDTKTCLSFTYSGRSGNQNNFISLAECRLRCPEFQNPCSTGQPHIGMNGQITSCGATTPSICPTTYWCHIGATLDTSVCCPGAGNPCDLSMATGNGNGNLLRYVYDQRTQSCRQFQYTGMLGNQNNFMTQLECEGRCPVFRNPCGNGEPARSSQGQIVTCSVSNLNGCPNRFWCHIGYDEQSTLCCPGGADPCNAPLVVGGGQNSLPRHYYNSLTQQCLPFTYSGLGGNQNNFLSRADCERSCPGDCERSCPGKVFQNPCAQGDPATGSNGQYVLCTSTTPNVCPAGYWCHIGPVSTNSVCCPGAENPCLLPLGTGNGNTALPRWYFDINIRRCTRFTYSGTGGNQNNFLTMQDCQLRCPEFQNPCSAGDPAQAPTGGILFCSTTAQTCPAGYWCHVGDNTESTVCCPGASDPCLQAMVPGIGSSKQNRHYFNQNTRQCLEFTYTGRGGNQNNFLSEADCILSCPVFQNPCSSSLNPPQVIYCSAQNQGVCPAGYWCHIGASSQSSLCCPGASDPCSLQPSRGSVSGTGPLSRWYFDSSSRMCKTFQYTGLGGNQNNFLTQQDCQQKCPEFTNPCVNGEPFKQQGTGLVRYCNRNNPSDCPQGFFCHVGATQQSTVCCPSGRQDPCTIPLSVGTGAASLTRWYFNIQTRRCQQFTYTGLAGNENNFPTQQMCQQQCPESSNPCAEGTPLTSMGGRITYCSAQNPNICPYNYFCHVGLDQQTTVCCPAVGQACNLPRTIGRGTGSLQRYFFNQLTRTCESFIYTGLGGNANNFVTLEACRGKCTEFANPCVGQPYRSASGESMFCHSQSVCPPNYFCHHGSDTTTTMCCPSQPGIDTCNLPVVIGSGHSQLNRYYYNSANRLCVPFVYSGLGGNENNFRQINECQARCARRRTPVNPCARGSEPYKDMLGHVLHCRSTLGGVRTPCPTNYFCQESTFDAYEEAVCCPVIPTSSSNRFDGGTNWCTLPLLVGRGGARLQRWYYDRATRRCERFLYGGLEGNANNFQSQDECNNNCVQTRQRKVEQPQRTAMCPHGEPLITQQGQPVSCRGGDLMQQVNVEQCPDTRNYVCNVLSQGTGYCCPNPRSFCLQPRNPGDCTFGHGHSFRHNATKWGYNPATDSCIRFDFSGCGGNLNNFDSLEHCTNICCNKGYNLLRLHDPMDEQDGDNSVSQNKEEDQTKSANQSRGQNSLKLTADENSQDITPESKPKSAPSPKPWWKFW